MAPMDPDRQSDSKLKRTNLMKRRESQALLEGVRKNRLAYSLDKNIKTSIQPWFFPRVYKTTQKVMSS